MSRTVGVVGASGYAGVELLRLCAAHPELRVVTAAAGAHAGQLVSAHTPSLAAAYPRLTYAATDPRALDGLDLVFLALPHGESQHLVPDILAQVGAVVDLAADFRLQDPSLYPTWYGEEHVAPNLLDRFAYGLPELWRRDLVGTSTIAAPGCYPTAALLALAPLVRAGFVSATGIIVDAASGVSGAGRAPKENLQFGTVDGNFTAYGLLDHRHTAEMEQGLGAQVLFTPHLAPMTRGILATCYARPTESVASGYGSPSSSRASGGVTTADALAILRAHYQSEPFVVVTDDIPSTKATVGSNCAHLTARVDPRTGWVMAIAAIDNLVKGAAGQAVQCANLALDLGETTGLPITGVYP